MPVVDNAGVPAPDSGPHLRFFVMCDGSGSPQKTSVESEQLLRALQLKDRQGKGNMDTTDNIMF